MFYEECIDQKRTIQKMKRYLEFLGKHMNSASYQEYMHQQYPAIVKEDLIEYVNYSTHDFPFPAQRKSDASSSDELEKIQGLEHFKKERALQIRWLCFGLQQLSDKERTFLIERYVYHMDTPAILKRHGIVESTLNRNLRKAYLNLAIILKLEVMKKIPQP